MVAHFSDDRGQIQTRMVNGMPEISLSLSLARSVIYRSSIWYSVSSHLYAFPYAFCRRLLLRSDPSIGRNIIPSYLFLTWPGRGVHRHAFRSIRKTRPVDRRTVAHSHGLPLRGISSRTVRTSVSRAYARAHATAIGVCACTFTPRSSTPYRSFAAYNKLATRARIMPSYWK